MRLTSLAPPPASDPVLTLFRSGYKVYTTASPRNHALLESYGADACFDYRDPSCGAKIRAATNDKLYKSYDCIGTPESAQICADALATDLPTPPKNPDGSPKEYHYVPLSMIEKSPRSDVLAKSEMAYTAMGEAFTGMGYKVPFVKEDYEHAKMFFQLAAKLIGEGKLRAPPVELRKGGLEGIADG